MNERDFCYWLNGFVELTQGQTPNPAQWKSIKEHLDLVFKKVTPKVGEVTVDVKVDTKDAQKSIADLTEAMRKYRESVPPAHPRPSGWPTWTPGPEGITITC